MLGGMQDFELRVMRLLDHAAREHATRELVSHWADGQRDPDQLGRDRPRRAQAGAGAGAAGHASPATGSRRSAMNHAHHLTSWYGAIGMGGVIHTINPRLFDEQLVYIANHAEDRVLFYDRAFQPIVDRLKPQWTTIEHYVCFDDGGFRRADRRRGRRLCVARGAGARSVHALLHQRHHRQSQGRAVRAPLDDDPRDGGGRAGGVQPQLARGRAADRADVPRRRLGPAVRGRAGGLQVRLFGDQRRRGAVRPDEPREGHAFGGRADRVAGDVRAHGRDRRGAGASAAGHDRRLGRAARDDRADHGHGRQRQASVGHDRNLADRHRRHAAAALGRDDARTRSSTWSASRVRCRSGSSCA